jgi:Fe-S cluster assembly ATPase SufC
MGPNGSGKSTLAQVLAGREDYEVTGGEVSFENRDLLALVPEERARAGLVPRVSIPRGDSGRQQRLFVEGRAQCQTQGRRASPRWTPTSFWR